eukprot:6563062-Lingulodinium_polyedra.AAC.1
MVKTDGNVYPKTSTVRRFLAIGVPKFSLGWKQGSLLLALLLSPMKHVSPQWPMKAVSPLACHSQWP